MSTLTKNQTRILEALAKQGEMTRAGLSEATGIKKGFAKIIGASTLESGAGEGTLEGMGLVTTGQYPTENDTMGPLHHSITASGKKALEDAKKAAKNGEAKPKAAAKKKATKAAAKPKATAKKKATKKTTKKT